MRTEAKNIAKGLLASTIVLSLVACGNTNSGATTDADTVVSATDGDSASGTSSETGGKSTVTLEGMREDGVIDATSLFSKRDLEQTADTSEAKTLALESGKDTQVTEAGVYVLSGKVTDSTVIVEAADDAKVQLVLDGVDIANSDSPAIYVKNADKVFVTTAEGSENSLEATDAFAADGETTPDAVIFSKDDITLNGLGSLSVKSTDNGITGKDDLKVTGGTYAIDAEGHGLDANESVSVSGGTLTITAGKDGVHSKQSDDTTKGSVYVCGGTFAIKADSDGMQATTYLQIDGGTISIDAKEGLEATYVQINGGEISIKASDDGINATARSMSVGTPTIEVTGGKLSIDMGQGDTDALDVNGDLTISGGEIDITAQFAFDFDGQSSFTGGTITVNGEQVTEITNSMMAGGGRMGGDPMGGGMGRGPMGDPRGGMAPGEMPENQDGTQG